jgi:tRNA dimethylallyltransferase
MGESTLEEAVAQVTAATRRYARRQLTWFRNQLPADTMALDAGRPLADQVQAVLQAWRERGGARPRTRLEPEETR